MYAWACFLGALCVRVCRGGSCVVMCLVHVRACVCLRSVYVCGGSRVWHACMCVCVCVCEREREREKNSVQNLSVSVCRMGQS